MSTSHFPTGEVVHPRSRSSEGAASERSILLRPTKQQPTVPSTTYPLGVTHLALGKGAFE